MLWKALCAGVILAVTVGVATAEELFGAILKVEKGKISFVTRKKGEKGEEKSFSLAKGLKVVKGKRNEDKKIEAGEAIGGGLKNKIFQEISEKGVRAQIITNDDGKVTEIRVLAPRKKKD